MIGTAGVVAGLVFVGSLDRLVASPSRSGTPYDIQVSDVTVEKLGPEVVDDPRIDAVVETASAPVSLDGLELSGHALTEVRGRAGVDVVTGRLPRTPDEVVLGLRAAQQLGMEVGDAVRARPADGEPIDLAVVGTAVVPALNGEQLGLNALLTADGLARAGRAAPFTGAALTVAPGQDPDELEAALAERFEAGPKAVPMEVQNLDALGRLPSAVAGLVGVVAVAALVNALAVAVRRRRGDLALLRAIGFTGTQTGVAVVVMALAIVTIGLLIGGPVGLAIGSTLWRVTASGAFVATDASIRWGLVAGVALGAMVVALVASLAPARRAAQQSPGPVLRTE